MATYSDELVNYWGDCYRQLDRKHQLYLRHRIPFERFMNDPQGNEYWIELYFRNPHLFTHRPGGGAIALIVFLDDPESLLTAVLAAPVNEPEDFLPLLPRQSMVRSTLIKMDKYYVQEVYEDWYFKNLYRRVELHGERLIQPTKPRAVPKRYKTGGCRV